MLKKGGQPWIPRGPRGSGSDLVGDEALAYRAASNAIERDLRPLEKIKEQLNRLEQVRSRAWARYVSLSTDRLRCIFGGCILGHLRVWDRPPIHSP